MITPGGAIITATSIPSPHQDSPRIACARITAAVSGGPIENTISLAPGFPQRAFHGSKRRGYILALKFDELEAAKRTPMSAWRMKAVIDPVR